MISDDPDAPSVPPLPKAHNHISKITSLRRRLRYCEEAILTANPGAVHYLRAEIVALVDAIECLAWVGSVWMERARLQSIRDADIPKKSVA